MSDVDNLPEEILVTLETTDDSVGLTVEVPPEIEVEAIVSPDVEVEVVFEGAQGIPGPAGEAGAQGLSAYEVAVSQGFTDGLAEWFRQLHGQPGDQGPRGEDGPTGPMGPPGQDGQSFTDFEFVQSTPLARWIVNHNLGYYPLVTVLSMGGLQVEAEVLHVSLNQIQVSFDQPFAGKTRLI